MEYTMEHFIGTIVGLLVLFAIIRWAVRADDKINHQKATIALLMKLCEKQGVTSNELDDIKSYYKL